MSRAKFHIVAPLPRLRKPWNVEAIMHKMKPGIYARSCRIYKTTENAAIGCIRWLLRDGRVGSMVVLTNRTSGKWLGAAKFNSKGKIVTTFEVTK